MKTDTPATEQPPLLPCPFCGKQPEWMAPNGLTERDGSFWLGCKTRDCVAPYTNESDYSREEAIAAWNRRAAVAGQPREYVTVKDDGFTYAWLVEREHEGRTQYWDGLTFVPNAEDAQWFCRRIDAAISGARCGGAHAVEIHAFDMRKPKGDREEFARGALRGFKMDLASPQPSEGVPGERVLRAAPDTGDALPDLPPDGHPLRELGKRLADLLDAEDFNWAERMMLAAYERERGMPGDEARGRFDRWYAKEHDLSPELVSRMDHDQGDILGLQWAAWCAAMGAEPRAAPADHDDRWLLWFADGDMMKPEHFSGHGAQEAAEHRYRQASQQWTCVLFRSVALSGYGPRAVEAALAAELALSSPPRAVPPAVIIPPRDLTPTERAALERMEPGRIVAVPPADGVQAYEVERALQTAEVHGAPQMTFMQAAVLLAAEVRRLREYERAVQIGVALQKATDDLKARAADGVGELRRRALAAEEVCRRRGANGATADVIRDLLAAVERLGGKP